MHFFIVTHVWRHGVLWWHSWSYLKMVKNPLINLRVPIRIILEEGRAMCVRLLVENNQVNWSNSSATRVDKQTNWPQRITLSLHSYRALWQWKYSPADQHQHFYYLWCSYQVPILATSGDGTERIWRSSGRAKGKRSRGKRSWRYCDGLQWRGRDRQTGYEQGRLEVHDSVRQVSVEHQQW